MPMDLRSSMIGLTGTRPSTSSKQREIVGKLSFGQPLTAKEWKYYGRSKSAAAETQRMLDSQKAQQDRWLELTDIAGKKTGNPLLAPRVTGEDGTRWNNMSGANGHNTGNPLLAPLDQPKSIGLDSAFEEIRKQRELDIQAQENARLLSKFGSADFGREFNRQHALGTLRNQNLASEHLASNIASTRFNQQRLQSDLDAQREARKQKEILDSYILIANEKGRKIADESLIGLQVSNETKLRILDYWDKKTQAEIQAKRDAEHRELKLQQERANLASTNLKNTAQKDENNQRNNPIVHRVIDGQQVTLLYQGDGKWKKISPEVGELMKSKMRVDFVKGLNGSDNVIYNEVKAIIGPDGKSVQMIGENKEQLDAVYDFYSKYPTPSTPGYSEALEAYKSRYGGVGADATSKSDLAIGKVGL